MDDRDDLTTSGIAARARSRERVIRAIIGVGIGMILLFIALHGVNKVLLDDSVVFALDRDFSVSYFWTILLFAGAAVVWWRLRTAMPRHMGVWTAMAALCALLAIEGIAQFHSELEQSLGYRLNTLIIQPVLAIAVVTLFVMCVRRLPSPESLLVAAAVVTLVLAQLFSIANGQLDLPYAGIIAMQTLEEAMEMLTATLLLAAPAGLALGLPWRAGERVPAAQREPVPSA
jgi:hypothetical protein